MDLFNSSPKSFKFDRRSSFARRVKEAVSTKLKEFLKNYNDDVLPEYIVVLVCNEKDQFQVREDLEAFLGDESGIFVTWLWKYLSQNQHSFKADIPICKSEPIEHVDVYPEMSLNHQPSDLQVPKELALNRPTYEALDSFDALPSIDGEHLVRERRESAKAASISVSSPVTSMERDKNGHLEVLNGEIGYSAEAVSGGEAKGPRHSKLIVTDNGSTKLLSTSNDINLGVLLKDPDNCVAKKRRSVWDRLGQPIANSTLVKSHGIFSSKVNILKSQAPAPSEVPDGSRAMHMVSSPRSMRRITQQIAINNTQGTSYGNVIVGQHSGKSAVGSSKLAVDETTQKKVSESHAGAPGDLLELVGKHIPEDTASQRMQKVGNVQHDPPHWKTVVGEERDGSSVNSALGKPSIMTLKRTSSNQVKCRKEVLAGNPESCSEKIEKSPSVSEVNLSDGQTEHNTNGVLQSEVLSMKSRLQQMEMEMRKLRYKHANGVKSSLVPGSGAQNIIVQTEEDIESRTIFVTNVHFAATKAALFSHFSHCGPVLRVVILTDAVSGLPNGSVYVVFAEKAAVDIAVGFSGTSFMSRVLKIVRKTEASSIAPPPLSNVELHPSYSVVPSYSPVKPGYPKKQFSSSHLQWRRDASSDGATASAVGSK